MVIPWVCLCLRSAESRDSRGAAFVLAQTADNKINDCLNKASISERETGKSEGDPCDCLEAIFNSVAHLVLSLRVDRARYLLFSFLMVFRCFYAEKRMF